MNWVSAFQEVVNLTIMVSYSWFFTQVYKACTDISHITSHTVFQRWYSKQPVQQRYQPMGTDVAVSEWMLVVNNCCIYVMCTSRSHWSWPSLQEWSAFFHLPHIKFTTLHLHKLSLPGIMFFIWRNSFGHILNLNSNMISLGKIHKCLLPTLNFLLLCFPECFIHTILIIIPHLPFIILTCCHLHWTLSSSKNNNKDSLYVLSMCYVPGTILNTLYTFINLVLNRALQLSPFADEEIKLQCSKFTCSRLVLPSQAFSTALHTRGCWMNGRISLAFTLVLPFPSFVMWMLTLHYHVSFFKTLPNNSDPPRTSHPRKLCYKSYP